MPSDGVISGARPASVAVVILTLNEEKNLPRALDSVVGWASKVIVLDSGSTDRTREIATSYGCAFSVQPFQGYALQRNRGIELAREAAEWILFLDADEWVTPELKAEIDRVLATTHGYSGFYIKRRLMWMGRWIRRGYYPVWILRLARTADVSCEDRSVNEHLVVNGPTSGLASDFIHEDRKGIDDWIIKQNGYATKEAREFFNTSRGHISARLFGSQAERTRWLKLRIWNNLPPVIRPCLYFFFRYVVRGGFLDGRAGFVYHVLQGFWLQLMIDLKYLEMRDAAVRNDSTTMRDR